MDFLTSGFNIILIILGFGVLIFVRELGHFIAAKWAGIRTEAFAVGMGPVALAWRKGIGLRFGSTAAAYEKRVRDSLDTDKVHSSASVDSEKSPDRQIARSPDSNLPQAEMYRIGDSLGLGETEYSLRWLPIGGFVKMLGQEDANPNYVSNDPRSYTNCPVGKRMIVVSAGVIMNIILAMVLFIIAFLGGVQFNAPVVGDVSPTLPAGVTKADNADALGVTTTGLQPGDEVIAIDDDRATTFADLQIASAMSKPGVPVKFTVRRAGFDQPLHFTLRPQKDPVSGLLSIGIDPGTSTTLLSTDEEGQLTRLLERSGLGAAGVRPGMRLLAVNGEDVKTYGQVSRAADESNGEPLQTIWTAVDGEGDPIGAPLHAGLPTRPAWADYPQQKTAGDFGLLGLSPLTRIVAVMPGSRNHGVLQAGDIVIRLNGVDYPRLSQFYEVLRSNKGGTISATVLRGGRPESMDLHVNRNGMLMVEIEPVTDVLLTAQPITTYVRHRQDEPAEIEEVQTPISAAKLFTTGGTRVLAVDGQSVETWSEFRAALRQATAAASTGGHGADVRLLIEHPTAGAEREEVQLALSPDQVKQLNGLGWDIALPGSIFQPLQVTLTADGNPIKAVQMGFAETQKLVVMTYLTIDRLFRGSVGVEQLRGPVGIIHIGTKVANEGFMYILFFLGMISVNLAVINFLPMPIVDGGLFLFLIYEKFKGRPPPLAFQNATTIVGLFLIGTLFVITFYNDVLRLLS